MDSEWTRDDSLIADTNRWLTQCCWYSSDEGRVDRAVTSLWQLRGIRPHKAVAEGNETKCCKVEKTCNLSKIQFRQTTRRHIPGQNYIHRWIQEHIKSGGTCHRSVQNVLSYLSVSEDKNYVVVRAREAAFTNCGKKIGWWCWGRHLDVRGEKCIIKSFMICAVHQILLA